MQKPGYFVNRVNVLRNNVLFEFLCQDAFPDMLLQIDPTLRWSFVIFCRLRHDLAFPGRTRTAQMPDALAVFLTASVGFCAIYPPRYTRFV